MIKTKITFESWCLVKLTNKSGRFQTLFMYPKDTLLYSPTEIVSIEIKPLKSAPDAVV